LIISRRLSTRPVHGATVGRMVAEQRKRRSRGGIRERDGVFQVRVYVGIDPVTGQRWLPVTEVIRRANTTVARAAYGAQARAGAAVRNAALHPAVTTRAARGRVARLGNPRPVRPRETTSATREGISR